MVLRILYPGVRALGGLLGRGLFALATAQRGTYLYSLAAELYYIDEKWACRIADAALQDLVGDSPPRDEVDLLGSWRPPVLV